MGSIVFEEFEVMPSRTRTEESPSGPANLPASRPSRKKAREINSEFLQDMGYPTPLEFLVSIYSDENIPRSERMDAAKAAAPYVHAKLNNIDINANVNVSHEDALDFLDISENSFED